MAQIDERGAATYRFYLDGTSASRLHPVPLAPAVTTFVTGGLALVIEPLATAVESIVAGADPDVLVVVDVNCRPAVVADLAAYRDRVARVVARADVVKVSDEDLAFLVPDRPVGEAAAALLAGGAGAVLVTAGGDATTVVTATGSTVVAVAPADVVDTIGAGDSFTAGFVVWWTERGHGRAALDDPAALVAAVEAAHAVAVVVVTRQGADPPTRAEVGAPWTP